MRALILTENRQLGTDIENALKPIFICDRVETAKDAEYYLDIRTYNVLILDLLDKVDNHTLVNEVFLYNPDMMILALGDKKYEIAILRSGASDFISPPFNMEVISLRIQNFLKLRDILINPYNYVGGEIYRFSFEKKDLSVSLEDYSEKLFLSKLEYDLFSILFLQQGIVEPYSLLDSLFAEPELVDISKVSQIVSSLRKKIMETFNLDCIETIRNRGYRLKKLSST